MNDQQTADAMKFISEHIRTEGYPPSRRQIADAAGFKSVSDGQRIIADLVAKGLIQVYPGVARGIRVVVGVADVEAV